MPSLRPLDEILSRSAELPVLHPFDVRAGHVAHAPGVGIECRMAKEATDVRRCLDVADIKPDQAVVEMSQAGAEKSLVVSEEGWPLERLQEGDDVCVLNAR